MGISLKYWRDLKGQGHWVLFYLQWAAPEGFMQGNIIIYMFILVCCHAIAGSWVERRQGQQAGGT